MPVLEKISHGTDVLLEIDLQGARQVRSKVPECISVFILPPSRQARRMAVAHEELQAAGEFDCVIVNADIDTAAEQLLAWIHNRTA